MNVIDTAPSALPPFALETTAGGETRILIGTPLGDLRYVRDAQSGKPRDFSSEVDRCASAEHARLLLMRILGRCVGH